MKRSLTLIPAALAVVLTLAACQGNSETESLESLEPAAEGTFSCIPSGPVSDSVELEGDFGGELVITAGTPLEATEPESTTLIAGDGEAVQDDENYAVGVAIFNGRTGEMIAQIKETMQPGGPYHQVLNDALSCATVGDRTVITLPAEDMYGKGQVAESGIPGLEESDTLVIGLDFLNKVEVLDQATGEEVPLPDDAPQVDIAADGEPTITIPEGVKAPKELTVIPMVEGEGPLVTETDTVTVHYRGIIWRTGEEFDSSWARQQPADFPVNGVIDGFKEALVGYPVGSRLISIVPADDGGYGSDWLIGNGFEGDDVMVFVLDILSAS